LIRALKWGGVAAAGIVLGLLFGAKSADVSPDIGMLAGLGMVSAGIGSIAGMLWPVPLAPPSNVAHAPATDDLIDLRDPVLDVRTGSVEPASQPARRQRPLRPRTPPG
jgi:hypothetical protein